MLSLRLRQRRKILNSRNWFLNELVENVPPEHFQGLYVRNFYKGERSCPFSLEILSDFSPSSPCAGSMAQRVSLPAGSDKGFSPLTSAAFLKNCCTKKLSFLKVDFRVYNRIN
jgi:hypothetical protein